MNRIHGGNPPRPDLLDFSAALNPWGPPPAVRRAWPRLLSLVRPYPSPDARPLQEALARHHRIPAESILVGNGSSDLLYRWMAWLRPKAVTLSAPCFTEYEAAARAAGAKVRHLFLRPSESPFPHPEHPLRRPEAEPKNLVVYGKILPFLQQDGAILLANPSNPEGRLIPRSVLLRWISAARRRNIAVLVDEAFLEFAGEKHSVLPQAAAGKCFILRSLTKAYGLAGLRLGYLVGPAAALEEIRRAMPPWSVNAIAVEAGRLALQDRAFLQRSRLLLIKERKRLAGALSRLTGPGGRNGSPALEVFPSQANFLLCRLTNAMTSVELARRLARRKIWIRPCSDFAGLDGRHFRVAVLRPSENHRLIAALREVLSE